MRAQMWAERTLGSDQSWPAGKTLTHVCEDDKPQPIPAMGEQRVLDLLGAGRMPMGAAAASPRIRAPSRAVAAGELLAQG
jgi:hypothetical protein